VDTCPPIPSRSASRLRAISPGPADRANLAPASRANHIVGVKRRDRTFSGDTIYLRDGGWDAAVLQSSDRGSDVASLQLISELDFDVLAPWIVIGALEARRRIGGIRYPARS
jgi:hypothetical protein